jgi:preprotein translocase subunit SecA
VGVFGVVLTGVVLVGVAVFIMMFEKKRARQIQHDLRGRANEQGDVGHDRGPDR